MTTEKLQLLLLKRNEIGQAFIAAEQAVIAEIQTIQALDRKKFTGREWQVLNMVREGLQNKEIASELNISLRTVKFHVKSILFKYGVKSRHDIGEI